MKPAPFNGRLPAEKATPRPRRDLPPVRDDLGRLIFEVDPSPVRVRPFEPVEPVAGFVGRCYDCGTQRADRVGGRCPGGCPPLPRSCSECGGEAMDGHYCYDVQEATCF